MVADRGPAQHGLRPGLRHRAGPSQVLGQDAGPDGLVHLPSRSRRSDRPVARVPLRPPGWLVGSARRPRNRVIFTPVGMASRPPSSPCRSSSARSCRSSVRRRSGTGRLDPGGRRLAAFWHVTLPSIRWGLAYGVTLTTARALGELGAVPVVSGRIAGWAETCRSTSTTCSTRSRSRARTPPRSARPLALFVIVRHGADPAPRQGGGRAAPPGHRRDRFVEPNPRAGALMSIVVKNAPSGSVTSSPSTASRSRSPPASSRLCSARPVRQVHPPEDHRRPGTGRLGPRRDLGEDMPKRPRPGPRCRLRLPALRRLPAHDDPRQRRLRALGPQAAEAVVRDRSTSCSSWSSS